MVVRTEGNGCEVKWDDRQMKAAGELFLNVSLEQRTHFAGKEDDPVAIWQALESVHLQKRPGARFNAYDDLFSIQKKEGESLQELMTRIDQAMITVQNLRPATFTLAELDEELVCMTMVRSLPEQYKYLATTLQLADKLKKSTLQQAFITEDLNQRRHTPSSGPLVNALAANAPALSPASASAICDFCSLPGHLTINCYRYKTAQVAATKEAQEKRSTRRGGGRGRAQKANAAQETSGEGGEVTEFAGSATVRALDPSDVLSPLDTAAHSSWTADTGATSHMTPHRHWLRNYTPYRTPVRLADSTIVYSAGVGSVVFAPEVKGKALRPVEFERVLHVPALKSNLLSVLYLTHRQYTPKHEDGRDQACARATPRRESCPPTQR